MSQHAVFTAAQLMDMAVRIEEHGRAFYEACLSEPVDERSRELFQYLLAQEREHARLFARMKEDLDRDESLPESYPGELRSYVEAFSMKTLVRPSDADQVDRVMAEEHDHVRRLLALRRETAGRGGKSP